MVGTPRLRLWCSLVATVSKQGPYLPTSASGMVFIGINRGTVGSSVGSCVLLESFQKSRVGCKKPQQGWLDGGLVCLMGAPRLLSEITVAVAQLAFWPVAAGATAPSLLTLATPSSTVKEKLRLDPDSEIATTGVRVSLICPVSRCSGPSPLPVHHVGLPGGLLTPPLFPTAGEDAAIRALPGRDLCPPAVLRRSLLPPDEREEAYLDVPSVRQASPL